MSKQFNYKQDSGVDIVTPTGNGTGNSGTGEQEFGENTIDRSQGKMMTYENGKVVEHGADIVNTYKDNHMTAFNKFGNPTTMQDALSDPENTSVMIGRMQVKTSVALRQGFISNAGEFNQASIESPKPATPTPQAPFVSEAGRNFIQQASQRVSKPIFDAAVAKVFVATGLKDKSDAAINNFANELGVEPTDGERIVNNLIKDVMDRTEDHLAGVFGKNEASAMMNEFMKFDPHVRSNLLLRLYRGDRGAVAEVLSRIDKKNYF